MSLDQFGPAKGSPASVFALHFLPPVALAMEMAMTSKGFRVSAYRAIVVVAVGSGGCRVLTFT